MEVKRGKQRRPSATRSAPSGIAPSKDGERTRSDRGAGIVEFALVLPLLLTLLIGIMEFGVLFNRAQAIEAAAREGARLASISTTTNLADVQTRVDETLAGLPLQNPASAAWPGGGCGVHGGGHVHVVVTTDHTVSIPIIGPIPGANPLTLRAEAVFRCEG